MKKLATLAGSLGLLALGFGMTGSAWPLSEEASRSRAAAQSGDGSLVGTVKFLGTPPEPERLRVDQNNDVCGQSKLSQDLVVSEGNQGLKNVVLMVVDAPKGSGSTAPAARIEQKECEYTPHVQAVVVGQEFQILNSDALLHNIHAYDDDEGTLFNIAQPIQNQRTKVTFEQEGVVTLKCDVHQWMLSYVVVAATPHVAVTSEDGSFRIDGVPPGSYKLRAWHEGLGQLDKDVVVAAGQEVTVNFDVGQ